MKRNSTDNPSLSWTNASWVKWGAIGLFMVWLFYGLSAYYVVQKPLTGEQVALLMQQHDVWLRLSFSGTAVIRSLLDVLVALWLTAVALGLGLWLLAWLRVTASSHLEMLLYGVGLGFGVMGLAVLALGLVGWLDTAVLYIFTGLLTLAALPKLLPFVRTIRLSRPPLALTLFLTFIIGLALLVALLPPHDWDGLFYHLKGPKLYLAAGRIVGGVDIPHLNFPFLQEMLYMLAMGLRGDVTAKLLHFVFIFLLAGLVYVLARDQLKVRQAWLAVLFLFTMPMILNLGGQAYNDLSLAFYQVAALLALFNWQTAHADNQPLSSRWLILSGVLCGLAMGLKYTSFVAPLTLALLVIWQFRKNWRGALRPLLTLAVPAVLVALPWYLKSFWFTGNPVYPFVFGGTYWDAYRANAYAEPGSGIGLDILALLRLPHDLTLGLKDASADGQMGPFFLIFLPVIVVYFLARVGKGVTRPYNALLLFALLQYLFWMAGVITSAGLWQTRLMLPAFVALCPVLAWLLEDLARFDHPQFSLRRFVGLVIVFALVLNLIAQLAGWLALAPHAYVLGNDGRDTTLTHILGTHYVAMQEINQLLPEEAVVTFLYEPRSYYCDRDCRPDSILDELGHLEYLYGDAAGIATAWQQQGVTHVLVFDAGYNFVVATELASALPQDLGLMDTLKTEWLEPLEPVRLRESGYSLYAVQPAAP